MYFPCVCMNDFLEFSTVLCYFLTFQKSLFYLLQGKLFKNDENGFLFLFRTISQDNQTMKFGQLRE